MSAMAGEVEAVDRSGPLLGLTRAVEDGAAHTVRVCFSDHYGVLRGRRIGADLFIGDPCRQGFCDGALVWDIRCDIFEGTDFSNYRTGYPDLYVEPELGTLRPCSWTDGEWVVLGDCRDEHGNPLDVDPRAILRRVCAIADRNRPVEVDLELQAPGVSLERGEWLLAGLANAARGLGVGDTRVRHDRDRETIALALPALPPVRAADATVLLRGAAREIARQADLAVSAMSQLEPGGVTTRMLVRVESATDPEAARDRTEDLSLLLRPLPAGAIGLASATRAGAPVIAEASSDASPYTAIAVAVAAVAEEVPPETCPGGDDPYDASIADLGWSEWVKRWFPRRFIHDAVALAQREARICADGGGPWDRSRYWECG